VISTGNARITYPALWCKERCDEKRDPIQDEA
jgi:hypothetical protein